MANNLLTPQAIANAALYQLQNTRVLSKLVNTAYSNEFASIGQSLDVRVPATLYGKDFKGRVKRQDLVESYKTVRLDRIADVSVAVSAKELTLDIKDFEQQVIAPAVRGLNQKIDGDIASFIYGNAAHNVTATSSPTDLADIGKLANYLDNVKAPVNDRNLVLSPDHKYKYAVTANLSHVSKAGDNQTLREARLDRVYGLDTFMSQNVPYSLADTVGTATAYKVEVLDADDKTVKLTSVTPATGTIKKGDGFIYDGKLYRFNEDKTAVAGEIASIELDAASEEFVNTTAVDAILLPKAASIAFHKDAITLATRPLEPAIGGAESAVAQGEGFAIRVTMDYDTDTKQNLISLDVLYGLSTLHNVLISTLK